MSNLFPNSNGCWVSIFGSWNACAVQFPFKMNSDRTPEPLGCKKNRLIFSLNNPTQTSMHARVLAFNWSEFLFLPGHLIPSIWLRFWLGQPCEACFDMASESIILFLADGLPGISYCWFVPCVNHPIVMLFHMQTIEPCLAAPPRLTRLAPIKTNWRHFSFNASFAISRLDTAMPQPWQCDSQKKKKNAQRNTFEVLHMPQKMTMEVSKVLRLPRQLQLIFWQWRKSTEGNECKI